MKEGGREEEKEKGMEKGERKTRGHLFYLTVVVTKLRESTKKI